MNQYKDLKAQLEEEKKQCFRKWETDRKLIEQMREQCRKDAQEQREYGVKDWETNKDECELSWEKQKDDFEAEKDACEIKFELQKKTLEEQKKAWEAEQEDWEDEWEDDNFDDLLPTPSPSPAPDVPGPTPSPTPSPPPSGPLTLTQRRRIESLTSVFEFSNTIPQYGYAENLGDGRGITFGRCGFCTGTGDGLLVVEEYTRRKPSNSLANYLPALRRINKEKSGESNGDTTGLTGFVSAVRALGNDATFRAVQDYAHQLMYMKPSQRAAAALGLEFALSRGQLYDAYLMHGENAPGDAFYPKSANGMAAYVNKQLGGSPTNGVDEKKWMRAYLAHRRTILTSADKVWAAAANRIDIYRFLANADAWDLSKAIKLQQGSCGSTGVCSQSSTAVAVGPAVYGNFNIN
jgi:chitosanase